jgi:trigger factor
VKIDTIDVDGVRSTFDCVFTSEDIAEMRLSAIEGLSNDVHVPGFRAGRVPENILKRKLAANIEATVQKDILCRSEKAIMNDLGLNVMSITDATFLPDDETGTKILRVVVLIAPEPELQDYCSIELPVIELEPSDDEIMHEIKKFAIRRNRAPSGMPAVEGDCVRIKYSANLPDGVVLKDKHSELFVNNETTLILPDCNNNMIPFPYDKFCDVALGISANEKRIVAIKFPDDHNIKELDGLTLGYVIEAVEVFTYIPIIEDKKLLEWLGVQGEEDLRKIAKCRCVIGKATNGLIQQKECVFNHILNSAKFPEMPDCAYESDITREMRRVEHDVKQRNMSAKLLAENGEKIYENAKSTGKLNMHLRLTAQSIAKRENIVQSSASISEAANRICRREGVSSKLFQSRINKDAGLRAEIFSLALVIEVVDFLLNKNFRKDKWRHGPIFEEALSTCNEKLNMTPRVGSSEDETFCECVKMLASIDESAFFRVDAQKALAIVDFMKYMDNEAELLSGTTRKQP